MVTCDLDKDVSGEVLGWKLPAWQALLLHRVLPSCGGLLVYLTAVCFDFALVVEHFKNGDDGLASFLLVLMSLPAMISLIFTLASPPPGLQTELTAYEVNINKKDVRWMLMQIVSCLFFPIAAIGRYMFQIFWWVEAVCASRSEDQERTKEALEEARTPSPMELYLFLQAFIHSAPIAILNILDLMSKFTLTTFDKVSVQSVSIVAASLRMASTAAMYRRFEREKLCGRSYPWNNNNTAQDVLVTNKVLSLSEKKEIEHIYEPILKRQSTITETSYEKARLNSDLIQFSARNTAVNETVNDQLRLNSDLIEFSPRTTYVGESAFYDEYSDVGSETSSDYMPPVVSKKNSVWSTEFDSDDEYVRPVSIIDKVAPRRRDTEYTIEKVNITPPPAMPAPRPGSIAIWAEKLVENAESIPTWLSAPPRRKYCDEEVIQDEPDLPRRVPRAYMRGLEPQDATAAFMHFLAWYLFFVTRLISIACFINSFPVIAIIILFSHYQVMLLFLIVPQASSVRRGFYVFLAFIYLFCLMEFKVRFRHVRVWHVFWIIVCCIETIVFTSLWAVDNTIDNNWWVSFVIKVVFGSLILSYCCFLVYYALLKPRETIVYFRNKSGNTQ